MPPRGYSSPTMKSLRRHTHTLNFLIMLALIGAGISPACKFINGQASSLIEICTTFGVKKIAAPADFAAADTEQQQGDTQKTTDPCAFCLNAQTHKVIASLAPHIPARDMFTHTRFILPTRLAAHTPSPSALPEARGPPTLS